MVDIDWGMGVVVVALVVDRKRMGRGLRFVVGMEVDRKFAEVGSRKLKTDLDRRMFGTRKDLVIAVRRNLRNHPLRKKGEGNGFPLG